MRNFHINIAGLKGGVHHFRFDLGNDFFAHYGIDLVSKGAFKAEVVLNKHETFIEGRFHLDGSVELTCDRCLEPFDYPMTLDRKMIYKFGDENQEVSEDVTIINRNTQELDIGQLMFEFIALSVPMKKLHPKFHGTEDESIIYRSDDQGADEKTDPRWEVLKKLK